MRLVKDFLDDRICFYWSDAEGTHVSPRLATFQEAEEWWKSYAFSRYQGPERRRSIHDRRTNHDKRKRVADGAAWGAGRRVTDIPVRIDSDLAEYKILLLRRMAALAPAERARPS